MLDSTIAPDAEAAEDIAAAEMHEDQAIDVFELGVAADGTFNEGDDEGEEEHCVGVEGTSDLGRSVAICKPGGEPDTVDTEADAEAVVVAGGLGRAVEGDNDVGIHGCG